MRFVPIARQSPDVLDTKLSGGLPADFVKEVEDARLMDIAPNVLPLTLPA
jgi:hypothetical protein